jgi:hypothetical protein
MIHHSLTALKPYKLKRKKEIKQKQYIITVQSLSEDVDTSPGWQSTNSTQFKNNIKVVSCAMWHCAVWCKFTDILPECQ